MYSDCSTVIIGWYMTEEYSMIGLIVVVYTFSRSASQNPDFFRSLRAQVLDLNLLQLSLIHI